MIVVKLIGGLGNQLFQYAVGRHLAEIHKTTLKSDITGFEIYKLHKYCLSHFNVWENLASKEEVLSLTTREQGAVEYVLRRLLRRPQGLPPTHIKDKHFRFDPEILMLPDGVYLDGYWQSEKYFKDIEGIIRREFTIRSDPDPLSQELAAQIASVCAVSVHVRRGDYVSNPVTRDVHGTCSLDYYRRATLEIAKTLERPHFFVFSDDPVWVQENLVLQFPMTYVTHNDAERNYEDLRLMSLCKHHIVANSSFSWWAAWLNPDPDKIVVAPKKWFSRSGYDTRDLIPDTWITL